MPFDATPLSTYLTTAADQELTAISPRQQKPPLNRASVKSVHTPVRVTPVTIGLQPAKPAVEGSVSTPRASLRREIRRGSGTDPCPAPATPPHLRRGMLRPSREVRMQGACKVPRVFRGRWSCAPVAVEVERALGEAVAGVARQGSHAPPELVRGRSAGDKEELLRAYRTAFEAVLAGMEGQGSPFVSVLRKVKAGYERTLVHQFEEPLAALRTTVAERNEHIAGLQQQVAVHRARHTAALLEVETLKRRLLVKELFEAIPHSVATDSNTTPAATDNAAANEDTEEEKTVEEAAEQQSQPPSSPPEVPALNVRSCSLASPISPTSTSPGSRSAEDPTAWLRAPVDTSIELEFLEE